MAGSGMQEAQTDEGLTRKDANPESPMSVETQVILTQKLPLLSGHQLILKT